MFRRYPYWGWLLISLILWCMCGYYSHSRRQAMLPEKMTAAVNKDLNHRLDVFNSFISDKNLVRRLFNDSLSESESENIFNFPFFVYAYNGDSLEFWNTNSVVVHPDDSGLAKPALLQNEKGVFIQKSLRLSYLESKKSLVVLFPVLVTYPIENDYMKSHFVASPYIPVNTTILDASQNTSGSHAIHMGADGKVFSLGFDTNDIQKWTPDTFFIMMLISALLSSIWWLQLVIIYFTRKRSSTAGFVATLVTILTLRVLLYVFGLPFNLDTLTFFSPALYASSIYLSSLGDLFINTMCVLWLVIFVTRHTPYRSYFEQVKKRSYRYPITIVLIVGLYAYLYLFVNIVRSLVLDSSISFDVSHFYSINVYTILGLLVIGSITGISCLIIYLFNVQLTILVRSKPAKYILITLSGIILVSLTGMRIDSGPQQGSFDWFFYWIMLGWLMVFIPLLDIRNFSLVSDLFEPQMIFWAIFICVFCTGVLQYFNEVKERDTRIAFAKLKLSVQRDDLAEYSFHKADSVIQQDKVLKNFLSKPSAESRKTLNQYLDVQYFSGGAINKYQVSVYLFDAAGHDLHNKDTINSYTYLLYEKNESSLTNSPYLFYKEGMHERHFYLSYIPIYSDSINKILGYLIADIDLKKQATQQVYPELLQPTTKAAASRENDYAYAIYSNNKLISQTNNYPFINHLKNDSIEGEYVFLRNNKASELHYKLGDKRIGIVVHTRNQVIEVITLFSYLFGIQVLLAIIILAYQLYLSYFTNAFPSGRFIRFTLRKRVHFSMLIVAFISFVIIGSVTIVVFTDQFRSANKKKLQESLQSARKSIQEVLKPENTMGSSYRFDTLSSSSSFKNYIATITTAQNIDINIFNAKGILMNTSEEEIYNKGLISSLMRPDAFYQLNTLGKSMLIQDETVAGLSYLSAYQPIRNEQGTTLGYVNVPVFSSEKELHFQISNIVVTLINLYAFIFLLSSVITVLITRWITRTFNIIIEQFSRLNLQRNERISWPYDDEIGLLVREYNKMVNKVEENAAKLAQSEREGAWREMARQVAHEIKNPLTPMKLNIQYLQQAMRNDSPNIKELTDRVSYSIIEQIDNLSYIASEFSNFAKMPEARAEELELVELLNTATELYTTNENIRVTFNDGGKKIFVLSDHSQLLRVFTNLLENAKQAIPEDNRGQIDVSVLPQDEHVVITITDNGPGIPEEVVKKMFQPYFTTKSSGTGLGLAMTKKIIEFWKGEIWFETKEGKGTTFYIKLPVIKS